jgi:hypothetical protein
VTRTPRLLLAVVLAVTAVLAVGRAEPAYAENPIHPDNRPSTIPGATNGWLPAEVLLHVAPSCQVYGPAASSLVAMIAAAQRDGIRLLPAECYRDYAGQVAARNSWCARGACQMAAVPGSSNHGWGKAVDFNDQNGSLTFEGATYKWLKSHAGWFGWNHPGVMEPGGSVPEPWHWEWVGDGGRMFPGITFGFGKGFGLPVDGNPAGSLDFAVESSMSGWMGTARVGGWAIDPNTTAPVDVHVYVDGIGTALRADKARTDVAELFAGYAASPHGFDGNVTAMYGRREVCAYGINALAPGQNALLNCVIATFGTNPIGSLDAVAVGQSLVVGGWVLDADSAGPLQVHAYIDGQFAGSGTANTSRPDVDAVFPRNGSGHGFELSLPAPNGTHTVCVYGINVGPGGNSVLGCREVTSSRHPFGFLDSVLPAPGGLRVNGWAIDPDTPSPIDVHTYIDGQFAGATTANSSRPDVGAAIAGYGPNHGYTAAYPAAPGRHTVCTYAINVGAGSTVLLGCRAATV